MYCMIILIWFLTVLDCILDHPDVEHIVYNGKHEKLVQPENHEVTKDQQQDIVENQFELVYNYNYYIEMWYYIAAVVYISAIWLIQTFNKIRNIFQLWNVTFPAWKNEK